MRPRAQDVGRGGSNSGPTNPTPLADAFYAAWRRSGLTLDAVARRAAVSIPTVSAYVNGTRGSGSQQRSRPTIVRLARALDMDPDATLALAGMARESGVIEAIRADPNLSRRDKEMLIMLYEQRNRP